AFVAVAEKCSFTQAAASMHLTQSALSMLIRGLENELGSRVFDRTTRAVHLTDAGSEFLPVATSTLANLQNAVTNAKELADRKRGRVVVAATPLFSSTLLPRLVARYREAYPGVVVVIRDSVADQIQRKVRDGEADFGIGTFENLERELVAEPLMTDTLVVVCPHGHPFARRTQVAWRALAGHPFIALVRDNSVGQLIAASIATANIVVRPAYEVSFLSTAVGLVDAGLGITVMPSYAQSMMHLFRIHARRLVAPSITREMSIITRGDRSLTPAAESLHEFIHDYAKTPESGFA
ncbi:MAG: LysR family transcriptional regulator, partial [Gemmatimonadaceae bacterium]|nr:LysR family transcriptional regulator [Gemmatimonadaceae bacterium]